jgi:hypothetical protein
MNKIFKYLFVRNSINQLVMKRIYQLVNERWQAETPAGARAVKAVLTWIAGSAVAVSVGFDTMPASLQSYLPQTVLSLVAGFSFLGRIIAGLSIVKGGENEKTS